MLLCLAVYISAVSMVISSGDVHPRVRPCALDHKKQDMPPIFTLNGTDLESNRRHFQISAGKFSKCLMNLTEVVEAYNFSTIPVVGYFELECATPIRLYVEPYRGTPLPHILQYIKIVKCVTSLRDLNAIAGVGTVRVVFMLASVLVTSGEADNGTQCSNLKSVSSFAYSYQGDSKLKYNSSFDDVLSCTPVFENLAEVIFSGMAWSTLPSTLEQKCPNLQSLDIPQNKFTKPPTSFPWNNQVFSLPGNLTRSAYLQSHYVKFEYLNLASNIFRRTYRLDDNLLRNISDYTFEGFLHFISLERNKMVEIGKSTFNNVTGVQHISLRENELTDLPCNVFKSLNELTNLDLSKNKLSSLCDNTFDSLVNLKYLNLANNSLSVLGEGLFQSLNNLRLIHLEFNDLKVLNPAAFPIKSLELNEIYLFNNPLETLPEFIFWLRSLLKADLHHTNVTLGNFTFFLETMDERKVEKGVAHSLSYINYKETAIKPKETPRIIDLSDSQITDFNIESNIPTFIEYRLRLLFVNFRFILKGSPLDCDCKILPISRFVSDLLSNGSIDTTRFMDWTCTTPMELRGRPLIHIRPEETYCRIAIQHCPTECDCFQREVNDHIIVDCRGQNLSRIHDSLPRGTLELWYSNNVIAKLSANPNFVRVFSLDVSGNQIDFVDPVVSLQLINIKRLFLQSNLLAYLPQGFERLTFDKLTLSPNPLSCDCNTLWMKKWLISQVRAIVDLSEITCFVNNEDGNILINVPDEEFVCDETVELDTLKHIVLPSVTSTVTAIIFLVVVVVIYAYRQECKVLMFVYFGFHPFDKDGDERGECIDCIIVHSGEQTTWVMDNIVQLLESENFDYKVCDMARDFVVGLSFQENLTRMVTYSKRILFCLTKDWDCSSESFIMSWNIAQEKIKETRSNFGIVVTHEVSQEKIKDKDLRRFLKRKRNVDTKERLFTKKLLYYMPSTANSKGITAKFVKVAYENQISVIEIDENIAANEVGNGLCDDQIGAETSHAFISYCDDNIDYVTKQLQPLLEQQGFLLCIPDRDFIPGESKESNILHGIESSKRTILILSKAHMQDEWSLFTFRHAYEKSLRQKNNHLIVILMDNLSDDMLDDEVRNYLNHYITLGIDDRWFQKKLFNGLPLLRGKEYLHTSPLYFANKHTEARATDSIVLHF